MNEDIAEREMQYRREALASAKEKSQGDRVAMYQELKDIIANGVSIAQVCRESGLARSTVYRWLDDLERMGSYVDTAAAGSGALGWKDIKMLPTGEVYAVDLRGDAWMFEPGDAGEAWNRTQNKTFKRSDWPDGAQDAFDSVSKSS